MIPANQPGHNVAATRDMEVLLQRVADLDAWCALLCNCLVSFIAGCFDLLFISQYFGLHRLHHSSHVLILRVCVGLC